MSLQYYDSDNEALIPIAGNVNPSDVIELKATKADKTQISNPNLLDNPWFMVNQRKESTYAGDDTWKYTVDRWAFVANSSSSVSIMGGGKTGGVQVSINSASSDNALVQVMDTEGSAIDGKQITVSIDLDNVIYSGTINVQSLPSTGWDVRTIITPISGFTVALARNANGTTQLVIRPPKNDIAYAIKAVKMEIGNLSTLALDTFPNYQSELLKCQRYFVNLNPLSTDWAHNIGASGVKFDGLDGCCVFIPLPARMRTIPVINVTDYGRIYLGDGNIITPSSVSVDDRFANGIRVWIPVASTYAKNVAVWIDYLLTLSADL